MVEVTYIYEHMDYYCVEVYGFYYKVPRAQVLVTYRNGVPTSYSVNIAHLINGKAELSYD